MTVAAHRLEAAGTDGDNGGGDDNGGDGNPNDPGTANGNLKVRGAIANFNPSAQTFSLLGLTVNYSAAEQQGNFGNGSFVKVDGHYDGNRINAREVEIELDDDRDENIEATGVIENFNSNSRTFQLLEFTVHFDNAEIETNLANGISVDVEGLFSDGMIFAAEIR